MSDAVTELGRALDEARAIVTVDAGASFYRPCTFCGHPSSLESPHKLYDIGHYPDGTKITRPVCKACSELGEKLEAAVRREVHATPAEVSVLRNIAYLAALAHEAPSWDVLPPTFDDDLAAAVKAYLELMHAYSQRKPAGSEVQGG